MIICMYCAKGGEDMGSSKYKLYGTINFCDNIVPNFVSPIFIDQVNRLYIGDCEDGLRIKRFSEIDKNTSARIRPLEDTVNILVGDIKEQTYRINDLTIGGIEYAENRIFLARVDVYAKHMETYHTDDEAFQYALDYEKARNKRLLEEIS